MQTSKWASKQIFHNLILFAIYVFVKLTGLDISIEMQNEILTHFDLLYNGYVFFWNYVIKTIDRSTENRGELNLSWWNIVGIFRELLRVIGVIRGG